MMKRVSEFLSSLHTGYLMYLLLVVTASFFWLFNFSDLSVPLSNPQLVKISGGEGLLDLQLYYTPQQAHDILTQYGVEGRDLYKRFLQLDFVFAISYGLGFSMLFTRLLRAVDKAETGWLKLNLLPLGIALADISENVAIYTLLNRYPDSASFVATLAGMATLSKHLLTLVTLASLLVLAGRLLILKTRTE